MSSVLMAGGHRIHKTVGPRRVEEDLDAPPKMDPIPVIDRYTDLASAMHRVAVVPVRDRFVWGCTCGAFAQAAIGGRKRAEMTGMAHVMDMAQDMHDTLEAPKE